MQDSFVFYKSFYESIKDLDAETFKECVSTLIEYALWGTVPEELSPMANMYFVSNQPQIDANNKRRSDGSKGGRPKKPLVMNDKTSGYETKNHRLSTEKPNVNVNDNVNDNVNVNGLINYVIPNKVYPIGKKKTKEDVLKELDVMIEKERTANG